MARFEVWERAQKPHFCDKLHVSALFSSCNKRMVMKLAAYLVLSIYNAILKKSDLISSFSSETEPKRNACQIGLYLT